mmetsp:Transcript_12523/g.50325  ORF Transcript_12523/g.50325 Transcript_12523/m.50325 type:complete len:238 (-) Transcript_12523:647-1360(-)
MYSVAYATCIATPLCSTDSSSTYFPLCSGHVAPAVTLYAPSHIIADGHSSAKNEKSSAGMTGATSSTASAPNTPVATEDARAAALTSLTVGGYSSLTLPSGNTGVNVTAASHPCASAVPVASFTMAPRIHSNVRLFTAWNCPMSRAVWAITLSASPPASNTVTVISAESSGSVSLDTIVCVAITVAAPHTTTSTFLWGTAACPPAPVNVISNEPLPAMMVPERVPTVPLGVSGYGQL